MHHTHQMHQDSVRGDAPLRVGGVLSSRWHGGDARGALRGQRRGGSHLVRARRIEGVDTRHRHSHRRERRRLQLVCCECRREHHARRCAHHDDGAARVARARSRNSTRRRRRRRRHHGASAGRLGRLGSRLGLGRRTLAPRQRAPLVRDAGERQVHQRQRWRAAASGVLRQAPRMTRKRRACHTALCAHLARPRAMTSCALSAHSWSCVKAPLPCVEHGVSK
jgi:hypothetical protein